MVGLKLLTGFITVLGIANHPDEVIKVAERQQISLKILGPFLGLSQKVASPADDDLAPVLDETIKGIE
jgi:hypothetical protein